MIKTTLSILVPIYNVERYLEECLDTVISQSYKDIEIICINDGSTDGSGEILKRYKEKDKRIVVIDKGNSGYGNSMNIGLKRAKGKYIGIVESDDFVEKNMYENLMKIALETNAEIIRANFWKHKAVTGDVFYELQEKTIYNTMLSSENYPRILWAPPFVWTGVYNREFLINNDIWFNETPGASFQDVGFMFKALAMSKRIMVVRDAFYHYRCDNEFASTKSPQKKRCVYDEFESVNLFFKKHKSFNNLKYYIPVAQFKRCYETFLKSRLEERIVEVGPLIDVMQGYKDAGLIKKEYWEEEDFNIYSKIQVEAIRYYWRYQFAGSMKNQGDVYIYGAGIVAQEIYKYLKACRVDVKAFLVTDATRNIEEIDGIPVIQFREGLLDPDKCCIIIAVKLRFQRSIYLTLNSCGFKKIYLMTFELGDELGIDYRSIAEK